MSTLNILVPPPPYSTPLTLQNGLLNPLWGKWINQLYQRVGGASSPNNAGIASAIATLQSNVATLFGDVSTINASISDLEIEFNDLSQGRQL